MNADDMKLHICETFDGVDAIDHSGDTFFIYDPERDLPPRRQMPFATLVTGDRFDSVSELSRPGIYRLNIGLTKATYASVFGPVPTRQDRHGVFETGYDHAATDTLMPHPVYASQYWACVLNPGAATLDTTRTLLVEAHSFAARKHANRRDRHGRPA